jgi:hypothetical protein
MNKVKKNQTSKNAIQIITITLGYVLIAVLLANVIYATSIAIHQAKARKVLLSAIDTAVTSCDETLSKFDMTDEQKAYIDLYKQNIDNCDTTIQKAYIANAMMTYAVNSTNTINSERVSDAYNNGSIVQSQQILVTELTNAAAQLQAATYNYTIYDEN